MHEFVANFTEIFSGAQAGRVNRWSATNFIDKVIATTASVSPQYWPGTGLARPLPGLADAAGWEGVTVIAEHVVLWRGDTLLHSDLQDFTVYIPIAETAVSLRAPVTADFIQPAPGGMTGWLHYETTGTAFVVGQFVRIDLHPDEPDLAAYLFYTVADEESFQSGVRSIRLQALEVSGQVAEGTTIPAGTEIVSMDANEAGEIRNVGANVNGDIFAVVPLNEYGVILKRRSIQSMQYVGRENGVFFIRGEIQNEGPISRNAWGLIHERGIVFLGTEELYEYRGGQDLTPICQQHSKLVFKELDRSRADEIVVYHNKRGNEIWVVYPVLTGETRVLIYNYAFQTATLDDYDAALNGITAIGTIDWEVAPTWASLEPTRLWETETLRWYELVEDGQQPYTVIAVGGDEASEELGETGETVPRLLLHGRVFSRASKNNCNPVPYLCKAETNDYDFGDGRAWKYLDTVYLNVEVKTPLDRPMHLYVAVGARDNLDSDIRWTAPSRVEVSGNGMKTTKVNLRASGRFLRLRFFSQSNGIEWRIAGFTLIGRKGGTF